MVKKSIENNDIKNESGEPEKKVQKKRGRKPKGGKIIKVPQKKKEVFIEKKSVILHLRCSLSDINIENTNEIKYQPVVVNYEPYSENNNYHELEKVKADINEEIITENNLFENNEIKINKQKINEKSEIKIKKTIDTKLKDLEKELNINDINRKSACFWCTYDFSSPTIYIPSLHFKGKYNVYGCFCSPECACSYLFNEQIDDNTKFERYQMLNYLYGKAYDYKKNIKPAPTPYYILDKYYGNLTIQEYRKLLEYDRLLLVINKPLTKVFPELHEDNNDFETIYENKISLKKNTKVYKNDIISKVFKTS